MHINAITTFLAREWFKIAILIIGLIAALSLYQKNDQMAGMPQPLTPAEIESMGKLAANSERAKLQCIEDADRTYQQNWLKTCSETTPLTENCTALIASTTANIQTFRECQCSIKETTAVDELARAWGEKLTACSGKQPTP